MKLGRGILSEALFAQAEDVPGHAVRRSELDDFFEAGDCAGGVALVLQDDAFEIEGA
ncbi:MAG: hypothetical protein IPL39_22615 [Opitutaceae bacterium]|nr:hypothetical protein [Opitutaceae bacterium]